MTTPSLIGLVPPAFKGAATSGHGFDSMAERGTVLVLYFYPKDNTPGCSDESAQFTQLAGDFKAAGARIYGISRDSLRSHESFRAKYSMPFELISDADETICQLFDVIRDKQMYGRTVRGIERSTFIIDQTGVVRAEWRRVKVPGHAAQVLAEVLALGRSVG
ncbi:peroxiredoxin [soil metagenome]